MIGLPPTVSIYFCTAPISMRLSFDGLAGLPGLVRNTLALNPLSRHLFLFLSRRRDKAKLLFWDKDGYALFYKRLERGRFHAPRVEAGHGAPAGKPWPRTLLGCRPRALYRGREDPQCRVGRSRPQTLYVKRFLRGVYAKVDADGSRTVLPLAPIESPFERGRADSSLLSFLIVSKFCDHLPLLRIHKILLRQGVHLSPSTMSTWLKDLHALLLPIYFAMGRAVREGPLIHADETPCPVQLDRVAHMTHRGFLWVYGGEGHLVYEYTSTRGGEHRARALTPPSAARSRPTAMRATMPPAKAYLFFGSEEGARRGAVFYSLVQSCVALQLDPREYLEHVMARLSDVPESRILGIGSRAIATITKTLSRDV